MSLVIETLEKIEKWLQLNCPSVASFHYPGLTNGQIEELTQKVI